MNYKFLPFAIGMALASTAANAETLESLEVKKQTVLDSTLLVKGKSSFDDVATFNNSIGVWGVASLESASITIPWIQVDKSGKKERTQREFINCYDALTNAYNNMFKVSYDG